MAIFSFPNPLPSKLQREKENTQNAIVNDVTEINAVKTRGIVVPHTIEEISD